MKGKTAVLLESVAVGVALGAAFYVLGAVGSTLIGGVSAVGLSVVGFASGFAATFASVSK